MQLSFIEELAWREDIHKLYMTARDAYKIASEEEHRYREYLKDRYAPQPREFT